MHDDFPLSRLLHLVKLLHLRTRHGSIEWKSSTRKNYYLGGGEFRTSTPSASIIIAFNGRKHSIRIMNEKGDVVSDYATSSGSFEHLELDSELERLYELVHAETLRVDESIERVIRDLESGL